MFRDVGTLEKANDTGSFEENPPFQHKTSGGDKVSERELFLLLITIISTEYLKGELQRVEENQKKGLQRVMSNNSVK